MSLAIPEDPVRESYKKYVTVRFMFENNLLKMLFDKMNQPFLVSLNVVVPYTYIKSGKLR